MEQGAAQSDADRVVVVLACPAYGLEAVEQAAQEAARRGCGLVLLAVDGGGTGPAPADAQVPEWVQHAVTDLVRCWPELSVDVVAPGAAAAHPAVLGSARLIVVDAHDGEAVLTASGSTGPLGSSGCPVLVVGRPDRCDQARVVVAAVKQDAEDPTVVQRAVDEAALRGCELRLVLSCQWFSGEPGHSAAGRAHRYLEDLATSTSRVAGIEVTAVCIQGPAGHALAQQAHGTELLVVHGGRPSAPSVWLTAMLRHPPTDVLVLPLAPDEGADDGLPTAYREALQRELARQPDRADGCTTPEELDQAWQVGTANPTVSADVAPARREAVQRQVSVTGSRVVPAREGVPAGSRGEG